LRDVYLKILYIVLKWIDIFPVVQLKVAGFIIQTQNSESLILFNTTHGVIVIPRQRYFIFY